ncbi:hypothetical protein RND71_017776 [Anisodus tanguticus]|uniref:Uncharacterized protein n=1 Tax=Anisodus tanguticus TaxID=243964 RepID=A0AAE1S305_9SOLA|nr:hypothetical protein RND71_017776 [Anisodus tanguticus]
MDVTACASAYSLLTHCIHRFGHLIISVLRHHVISIVKSSQFLICSVELGDNMNSLSSLLRVCHSLPHNKDELSAYETARFGMQTPKGKQIADIGCEPILHMRHFQRVAFCAYTGGSMLVIDLAAGVAFMGIGNFFWSMRKVHMLQLENINISAAKFVPPSLQVSGLAFAGYAAGIAAYLAAHIL